MDARNIKPPIRMSLHDTGTNVILDVISSQTRLKILSILSEEPMYFNQLAKKIDIGQQSILRHMNILERSGLIETYVQRSSLGGPNRKYYKVKSSFNLNVSLSKDSFSLVNREIDEINYYATSKLYKGFESRTKVDSNNSLIYLRDIFLDIENQINVLEEQINELRAMKQKVFTRLQTICEEIRLGTLERNIVYWIIKKSPKDLEELSEIMDIDASDLKTAINSLSRKLEGPKQKNFLRKYAGLQT